MTQNEIFGSAIWVCADSADENISPVIVKKFSLDCIGKAEIKLIGFGTFTLYVNGRRVSDDLFLPLNSEYERAGWPEGEELSARTYVTRYDITDYIRAGENTVSVLLGFGWYTGVDLWEFLEKRYGTKKLIFSISVTDSSGKEYRAVTDGGEMWAPSPVVGGDMHRGEIHDYSTWSDDVLMGEGAHPWRRVKRAEPVVTEYMYTDCPADGVFESLTPKLVYSTDSYKLYDAGRNISGYPILRADGDGEIKIAFSERLNPEGTDIDAKHQHRQNMTVRNAKGKGEVFPRFTWYGFRFFRIEGEAVPVRVDVVHSRVRADSSFETDNETLNWIYKTFIDTQLANMHRGIPSDCPHIERLGYTGDGQLVCRSALHTLDAEAFYRKWIGDIEDCQDSKTGHVQYTAPYVNAGGGPAGWGSAIINVPYEFWKYYGDESVISRVYPKMLKYLDFMDAHCESGLVISDLPGKWCLGDWCTPPDQSNLPAPFVNTCIYIRAINRVLEIAERLGNRDEDIKLLTERRDRSVKFLKLFYLNDFSRDGTYVGNVKGANAFAFSAGLYSEKTAEKLVNYYKRAPFYDTGIFGTEVLTRQLFILGEGELAVKLICASEPHGFGKWRENGETTFPEYWNIARSHNHPMFGAIVATFFEFILGIGQAEDSAGYERIVISPVKIDSLSHVKGSITTPRGVIGVEYEKKDGKTVYKITVPFGASAELRLPDTEASTVGAGEHIITV